METYKRTNRIQETLSLIFPNYKYGNLIKRKEVYFYKPRLNKFKCFLAFLLVVGCLLTPATNWLIVFIIGWVLR